jgi:hypothetical protein
MKLSSRAARALLVLAATAAPSRALAQEAEAWVLPRGLLELSGGGLFSNYDSRLGFGDGPLGSEFAGVLQAATERVTGAAEASARTRLADLFAGTTDPDPASSALPASLAVGRVALRLTGDERTVPFTVRYGLSDRLTLSLLIPVERRGTSVSGPYLTGGTLGFNPAPAANAAILGDLGFGDLGGGLLLPVAGTPQAVELQARLRAISPADTLRLPANAVSVAELLANDVTAPLLTDPEAAGFGLVSARRPYHLGDLQLGARFLLLRGPAGWPFPDSVRGRSLRTSVGARVRLPTGRSGTRFFAEIPPRGGHFGAGVDVLNDVFLSSRWYVNASASVDVLFPADVPRLAFSADDPFPADSAQRIVRSAPGPRLSASITPRWRLTDEISFSGEYALLAQRRREYTGEEGLLYSPLEWRTGGSMHALGVGARYSSLQAYARGRARLPFEITLTVSRAVAGGGAAPDAAMVRLTGRIFMDPRIVARLLPGDPPPADTTLAVPPAAGPADTLPSQVRPEVPAGPRVVPPQPDTIGADSTPAQVPPQASAAAVLHPAAPRHALAPARRTAIAPARRWWAADH